MSCVLLVTRDPATAALAESALATAGHEVIAAASGDGAVRSLLTVHSDAVVVDSAVGGEEVEELCDWLRASRDRRPLVFLASAAARWLAVYLPPGAGPDQIVVKPYGAEDIRRAVERALETAGEAGPQVLTIGDISLDKTGQGLRGNGAAVQLTPTEFRLVLYLAQRRGRVVPAEELLENVWEFFPGTGSSELVRSHVRNLRSKLRVVTGGAEVLQTVPRRGYRLG